MNQFTDKIQQAARSFSEFQAGRQLYLNQKATVQSVQSFWKDEHEIEAEVTDRGRRYRVKMTIGENYIYSANCNCDREMNASYRSRSNAEMLCRHCVSAALQFLDMGEGFSVPDVETSAAAQKLFERYMIQNRNRIMAEGQEPAELEPKLNINRTRISLELKIGRKKKYIIKNLYDFVNAMREGAESSYGKNLNFVHRKENFDHFSARIAELVMESVGSYRSISQSERDYYLYISPVKMRQLVLDSFLIDKFMSMMNGKKLLVAEPAFQSGNPYNTNIEKEKLVTEENPKLTLLIEKKGSDGASFRMREDIQVFCGEKHTYVSSEGRIYICDENYSQKAGPFLDQIMNHTGPKYGTFDVNEKDFPIFCQAVLPQLQDLLSVETTEVELEQYKPETRQTKFHLDIQGEEVFCQVTHTYGAVTLNPILGEEGPENLIRDEFGELLVQKTLANYFAYQDDKGNLYLPEGEEAMFALLDTGIPEMVKLGEVYISDALKNRQVRAMPKVSVGVSLAGNLLELNIDMGDLSSKELLDILDSYRQKRKFHRLKDGSYLRLENGSLDTVDELAKGLQLSGKQLDQETLSLPAYRSLFVEQILEGQNQVSAYRNEEFKSLIRNMKEIRPEEFQIPKELEQTLRQYQEEGFRWMKMLEAYGFGGILADDMGLGKTIQVIALLLDSKKAQECGGEHKTALIVCPASLVYNWEHEFHKFAPDMKVKTITGSAGERKRYLSEMEQYDALITSYDLLRRDVTDYRKKRFSYEIIDEAQFIKNHATQSAKAVKEITAEHRFALTGTPIENRLSELWSIFDFLMPGFLYAYSRFKAEFETPIVKTKDEAALKRFRQMTGPFILRRLKQDVLSDLPEKTEQVMYAQMEGRQNQLYQAAALKLKQDLAESTAEQFNTGRVKILAALTRLRQICCDPSLCFEGYEGESAKMNLCSNLIENSLDSGHKVLVFSQFTSMLSIIEEWLKKEQVTYYKLTGETDKETRMQLVSQFQQDAVPVFLISLKAGGTGLNLTAADIVIHYDPWWNVAAQNQATDRTHRIGQEKPVSVYKIITRGTIEEKILQLQESKRDLTEQILSGESTSLGSMSREELLEILS